MVREERGKRKHNSSRGESHTTKRKRERIMKRKKKVCFTQEKLTDRSGFKAAFSAASSPSWQRVPLSPASRGRFSRGREEALADTGACRPLLLLYSCVSIGRFRCTYCRILMDIVEKRVTL